MGICCAASRGANIGRMPLDVIAHAPGEKYAGQRLRGVTALAIFIPATAAAAACPVVYPARISSPSPSGPPYGEAA